MTDSPTKVFISYSHDSQAHSDFVRGIADQLCVDGIDCLIDQYINVSPPEGWQRWMENQVETADFVLLVCTKTYLRRYRGQAHLQQGDVEQAANWLERAVAGLHTAGVQGFVQHGLLARAALFRQTHNFPLAHQDLQEVFDIADSSGMRLYLTDYHLEMARLLLAEEKTEGLQHNINEAERLINETGYHGRDAELADLISKNTDSTTQRTSACSTT